jgi:hypothetical protein
MKIRYDGSGNINACCVDTATLGGSTVITIANNAALLANPWKYKWNAGTSSLVLREAVDLTTTAPLVNGVPTVAANGSASIVVTLTAKNTSGATDTAANFVVTLTDLNAAHGAPAIPNVTLASGVGTASFTSTTAKKMLLSAHSAGVCAGSLTIAFA